MAGEAAAGVVFPYHRSLSPMFWVLTGLSSIELLVVHGLVALWQPWVAGLMSLVSLCGMVWLVRTIRAFRRLPVIVSGDILTMRAGRLWTVRIPTASIAGLRADWSAADLKHCDVLNLGLLAWPNVLVELTEPVQAVGPRTRPVRAVAHRLDDPDAFRCWIATLPHGPALR